jgi:ribosome biogenesis GTPase
MYIVRTGNGNVACGLSTRFRKLSVDLVAIGDEVRFVSETAMGSARSGQIVEILPRRNRFARRSPVPMPSGYAHEQVIAANIDQIVPVLAAAQPPPSWHLLDRLLVTAEAAGIPAQVCITKADLLSGTQFDEVQDVADVYRKLGYPVILTSATTGTGLDELRQALCGRLSLLVGKSGVGKSSLLNALQPGLGLKTLTLSRMNDKGRHTTTHLEMFSLEAGGTIIDTPGIREFNLGPLDEDPAYYFPEMEPLIGTCKFGLGCQHDQEPGCAVRKAVNAGEISPYRYRSYLKLKEI